MKQIFYIDSSVALRAILEVPEKEAVQNWLSQPDVLYVSSRLLKTEVLRTLRREKIPLFYAAPLLSRVGLIEITSEIHTIAESFETHIKTLDALHVATALTLGGEATVATHDRNMKHVASHLGLPVIDPIENISQ